MTIFGTSIRQYIFCCPRVFHILYMIRRGEPA